MTFCKGESRHYVHLKKSKIMKNNCRFLKKIFKRRQKISEKDNVKLVFNIKHIKAEFTNKKSMKIF